MLLYDSLGINYSERKVKERSETIEAFSSFPNPVCSHTEVSSKKPGKHEKHTKLEGMFPLLV